MSAPPFNRFGKVYELVRRIPAGRVTTYGSLAKRLNMSPRVVGYALHLNPDGKQTPCHRVVNRDGRIAPGYAFGGKNAQKKLLEQEGVEFKDLNHLNIKKYFFGF